MEVLEKLLLALTLWEQQHPLEFLMVETIILAAAAAVHFPIQVEL
jgi:hypothetical protein